MSGKSGNSTSLRSARFVALDTFLARTNGSMRRIQVLIAFYLILSCGAVVTKANPSTILLSSTPVNKPRSLRITKTTNDEERMFEAISKWASTMWWLETGKTDDYIKKTLKLDGLTGTALKSAPNYAYYEHFLYTREGYMLENWLKKGYSTKEIWARYKLDDVPLTLLKDKDGFKTYLRYATMEDDKIFKLKKQDKDVEIDESNTASEMIAKVDMWVSLDRPSWYVKAMLDLDRRSYKAFHNSRNYWLYKRFEQANDDRTLATWLANKVPTERIWTTFKIDELSRGNRGYKIYVRYAKMKDDETFNLWFTGNAFERESGNIPSEMNTKVEIWADAKRPNSYVKEVLHLNKFAPKTSPNYKYYEKFVELREPV